jgi:hypothetical protein
VQNVRDGGNYAARTVTVVQKPESGIMFTCTCSFKRAEPSPFQYQDGTDLKRKYALVLEGKEPFDHKDAPSQDSKWYVIKIGPLLKINLLTIPTRFHDVYLPSHPNHLNPLPGLHLRKVDMIAFNTGRDPIDKRQLTYYSIRGGLPSPYPDQPSKGTSKGKSTTREANLHLIAHLYASDRNSLFIIPNHLELGREYTRMASLSHTVIFHVGIEDLVMPDEPPDDDLRAFPTAKESRRGGQGTKRKWFMQESWITRAGDGRGLHMTRLWDPERGVHLASTMQDGLVRFKPTARLKL